MEVSIIFKIAAVGILVSVLETQRQRGTGFFSQPGRASCGTLLDRTIYL